ncbi:MAG: glycosyl transferase [Myxococcaceae bacterium]|nr:glycosyl transferase [Myxococcaceae bacterium]
MNTYPVLRKPSVSIVVVNYNNERFLERAVASASAQTQPCEVIVVDDGSTDGSRALLAAWESRVRVIYQANAGQCAAYNTGFFASVGEVVIFLDGDDYLASDAAEQLASRFDQGVVKVHGRMVVVDANEREVGAPIPTTLASGDQSKKLIEHGLMYSSAPGSGNAYRRSVLERLFPIPVTVGDPHGADFFAVYGTALFGLVATVERPVAFYRLHSVSDVTAGFVFGNTTQGRAEAVRDAARRTSFQRWIEERTEGRIRLRRRFTNFAEIKGVFVVEVTSRTGLDRVRAGARQVPTLLRTLWLESERSLAMRLGLTAWPLVTLALPRRLADPVVRFVINPASRGTLRSLFSGPG